MSSNEFGKIFKRAWGDPDFKKLTVGEQHLYFKLISQPDVSLAGVLTYAPTRWAMQTAGLSTEDIERDFSGLSRKRYVVVDLDTQEVLVRSYIRNDLGWRSPRTMIGIANAVGRVLSPALRGVISRELTRLDTASLSSSINERTNRSTREVVESAIRGVLEQFPPLDTLSITLEEGVSDTPSEGVSDGVSAVRTRNSNSNSNSNGSSNGSSRSNTSSSATDVATEEDGREDVDTLCEHLAARIVGNGNKTPTITKAWKQQARLLLDRDQRDPDEAHRLIDWCQTDPFWMSNILSMPKFREKYDQLRLRAGTAIQPEPTDRYEPRQPTPEQQARIDEARARHEQRLRDAETERENELQTTQAERDAAAAKLRKAIGL